ncbi:MAG: tRNA pseudouridine(13) synthase TruD [Nanoarchaeota archaeon]|nr:tRNA pseudouridine(13) synthase TruD [Nanoarchaeota archaeon]
MIIKDVCEDFVVEEVPLDDLFQEEPASYHVYLLKKRNYTTERAITHLAQALHIPRKNIGFAGTKDKKAITTQYITIRGANKEKTASLQLKDIELSFVGYRKQPLTLGDLKGNHFTLLVKEVTLPQNIPSSFYVPNYFDEQRFSTNNIRIGRHILKKEYQDAVRIILETDDDHREPLETHLNKQKNDYVGALHLLPRKTLLFYVHAVQSFLFNEQLKEYMTSLTETFEVDYSEGIFSFPKELLEKEEKKEGELIGFESLQGFQGIEPYDFVNKSLPELSLPGGTRPFYSFVQDCKITEEKEGVQATFFLSKGCYATIVLKQLFSANQ